MMKKISLVLFLVFISFITYAQIWDYPVKPKTERWKALESNIEKVDVCQIPLSVLQEISTYDLMSLCLQYPLLFDIFAFNNINDGLRKLFSDFNGIREFSERENSIYCLQKQYLSEIHSFPEILSKGSNFDIGYSVARISILEVLLSYSDFHSNISKENQKKILENLYYGYQEKIKYPEHFQGRGFATNLFARAQIMIKIDPTLSKKFEKENKSILFSGTTDMDFSFGKCSDEQMYDIYTPMGTPVKTYLMCEIEILQKEYEDYYWSSNYPNAEMIIVYDGLSSTRKFNCHGYAWLRVEQGIDRWIGYRQNNRDPDVFMTDYSYIQVSSETFPGKVFWDRPGGNHSAVTTEQSGWFISKWGQGPLYRHRWNDSPFGTNFKYFVKNCSIIENQIVVIENQTITSNCNFVSCGDIEVQNVTISNGATVRFLANEKVVIKPNFHAEAGTNVVISIGSSASNQPQNSMLLTNNEPKVEKPYLQSLLINNTDLTNQGPSFKLYPSPNNGSFNIDANFPLTNISSLKITNLMGATVYETQNVSSHTIQLQHSIAGTFFVVIILKDGSVLTQKTILQK